MKTILDAGTTARASLMQAAVIDRFGGADVVHVTQVPVPAVKNHDLLVRVRASTVSAADRRLRARDLPKGMGLLAMPVVGWLRPRRRILGMDFSGVVEAVGPGVTLFKPGDEVVGLAGSAFGAHAEFLALQEAAAICTKPATLSHEEAVALVFGGHTVSECIRQCSINPGHEVLVNGASGAVGSTAVQVARHFGATVTAVTSGPNAELVRGLGVHHVIDYREQDFATLGKRYDLLIDCVGNAPFARAVGAIKPGGALLLVAISDLLAILTARSNSRRSGVRVVPISFTPGKADVQFGLDLFQAGALHPVIDRTFELAQIKRAHEHVDTGRKLGAVVVRISDRR